MKDRRVFFSKRVLSFPSPFAWYLCRSPTLSSTLEFGKAHSDIYIHTHAYIYISNQTLSGDRGAQCQARGEKRQALQLSKRLFLKPQYFLLTFIVPKQMPSYCLLNLESFSSITFLTVKEKLL